MHQAPPAGESLVRKLRAWIGAGGDVADMAIRRRFECEQLCFVHPAN